MSAVHRPRRRAAAELWGALGLVLATPLTVCASVMDRHIPGLEKGPKLLLLVLHHLGQSGERLGRGACEGAGADR